MAIRNIVLEGDSILAKKARPVVNFDDRLAQLLDDMTDTLKEAKGVGLAAPQVGILRRVVVIEYNIGINKSGNYKKQWDTKGCRRMSFMSG